MARKDDWRERARRLERQKQLQTTDSLGLNHRGRRIIAKDASSSELFRSDRAERAIVAAILMDPGAMGSIADIVIPDDFATQPAKALFTEMAKLWEDRIPADVITLSAAMDNEDVASTIADILNDIEPGQGAYVVYYARVVAQQAQRRRFMDATQDAIADLYEDASMDVEPILTRVTQETLGSTQINAMSDIDSAMEQTIESVTMERAGVVERREVSTGFQTLDQMLGGGWSPTDLVTLAARASMGKTSMAADFMVSASDYGASVLFSAEMSTDSVLRRLASRASGIPMEKIRTGDLNDQEYESFMAAAQTMQGKRIYIDDTPGITTAQMLLRVQRIQETHRVSLVLLDYLELVGDQLDDGRDDTHLRLSKAVERLKSLARVCDVPVVVLAQVGRSVDIRENRIPQLSDLRWTGMLEQTSDKVVMMYIHDYYVNRGVEGYDASREGVVEMHVHKNRNGPVGEVRLGYDPETFRFWDLQGVW